MILLGENNNKENEVCIGMKSVSAAVKICSGKLKMTNSDLNFTWNYTPLHAPNFVFLIGKFSNSELSLKRLHFKHFLVMPPHIKNFRELRFWAH